MERDDEHKKWVWKREPGRERDDKDQDGRATARDSVEDDDDELASEVSPLVSLWRSALGALHDAAVRADDLNQPKRVDADELN